MNVFCRRPPDISGMPGKEFISRTNGQNFNMCNNEGNSQDPWEFLLLILTKCENVTIKNF